MAKTGLSTIFPVFHREAAKIKATAREQYTIWIFSSPLTYILPDELSSVSPASAAAPKTKSAAAAKPYFFRKAITFS